MYNQRDDGEDQQQVNETARQMKHGPHHNPNREQYEKQKKEEQIRQQAHIASAETC
jgi:hypothetical protein